MKELIERLEKATGPDRKLDEAIELYIGGWHDGTRLTDMPKYTALVDEALTLVPEGWFWQCGRTSAYQAWSRVYATHPDHGEEGKNEFGWKREYWQPPSTPAIALCIAGLMARMAALPSTESR